MTACMGAGRDHRLFPPLPVRPPVSPFSSSALRSLALALFSTNVCCVRLLRPSLSSGPAV